MVIYFPSVYMVILFPFVYMVILFPSVYYLLVVLTFSFQMKNTHTNKLETKLI